MKTVRSFDVFDTCLTRRVAMPTGIHYEVARKVFARLGISATRPLVEEFVTARNEAERLARRQIDREEITLAEIWELLSRSMGRGFDKTLSSCELEAEEESLAPVSELLHEVQVARRDGHRIIFVSDMYLPTEFVARQLKKHGFGEDGDGVYVSSEIDKTKVTGNLFKHVLQMENISPSNLLHTGDNPHGDFAVPQSLGIPARLCEPARLTQTELSLLQSDGELDAAGRIAGAMRAFRLAEVSADDAAIRELAAEFVGPFVMGFAIWVLQRAQESGVKRLYFLSRDCQLVCKVARELAPQFGGIDCQYLRVSRQALFLPSAGEISPEGMPWMRRDFEEPVLKKLLAKIDLPYASIESIFGDVAGSEREAYRLKSETDWTRFWQALNTEPVKTRINDLVVTRRELARKYFESAGMLDGVPWALVDLGWALTCQQSLWKMLRQWGWPEKIRGFYFGMVNQRVAPETAGIAEALFYQPAPDFSRAAGVNAVFARVTLLEHIIGCADHPTVHHYEKHTDGKVGPAYASSVSESTLKFCNRLHDQALAFVRQSQNLVADLKDPVICRKAIAALVPGFFTFPEQKPASALIGLSATGDQNGLNPLPIVEPLNWSKALLPLFPKSKPSGGKWQTSDSFWLEGSIALTPSRIRKFSKLAQRTANRLAKIRGARTSR